MRKFFSLIAAVLFAGSMMADSYGLVSDASVLADGDEIIIVGEGHAKAMSTTQNSNNRGQADVTVSDDVIVPGENVQVITLKASGDNWKLNVGSNAYLYAASSSSNHLKTSTEATAGDNGVWAITINAKGEASIVAQGANSRKVMQYNATSNLFACYASASQKSLSIFKKGYTPAPTEKYYLVGSMNNWQISEDYLLSVNLSNPDEQMIDIKLAAGNAEMKVKGIIGETENWYPAGGTDNNFVINDAGYYTIYFRADGQGGEDWHYGYIYAVNHPLINCAAAAELAADEIAYMNEVLVTCVEGGNMYIKDESGYGLFFAYDFGLQAGDVVNGIVGISAPYYGLPELKPYNIELADLDIVAGEAPAPEEVAAAPAAADINKYLVIRDVAVEGEFTTASATNLTATFGEEAFVLRNQFKKAFTFAAGKTYDIVGVGAVNKNGENVTYQLYFISASEHSATAIDNTDAAAKAVKFFENGQLIILKNGVRYNAQGAIVK